MEDRLFSNSFAMDCGYETECWVWMGASDGKGAYPRMSVGIDKTRKVKKASAHRVSYETFIGPIPAGFELDHKCQVTRCIHPNHLQPLPPPDNRRLVQARKKHASVPNLRHDPPRHAHDDGVRADHEELEHEHELQHS